MLTKVATQLLSLLVLLMMVLGSSSYDLLLLIYDLLGLVRSRNRLPEEWLIAIEDLRRFV